MQNYDFLIVGAGLFGSVFANIATQKGKKCLVIDKRSHIGGQCYSENIDGIEVHKYGPHVFHTDNKEVWDYINQFSSFNNYIQQTIANINGEVYNLPFNMNLFSKVFKAVKPVDVLTIINKERASYVNLVPKNLEEQAIKLVGRTIYDKFIKGYTEKQWGKSCKELPPEIIKRLPLRFTYDNNYFNDQYQGIPTNGYTKLFESLLKGIEVRLNTDCKDVLVKPKKTIYTGSIDELFNYKLGKLEYRSLKWDHKKLTIENYQGCAVMNYPNLDVPYTRSIEHKHFDKNCKADKTIVSYEYSVEYKQGLTPAYPIEDEKNIKLYNDYKELAKNYPDVYFCGRLGSYKYYDMDDTIESSLNLAKVLL